MRRKCIFSITLALVTFGFLAANSAHATDWTVTQLTNNSYDDEAPQVWGSNVVWYGGATSAEWEIFLGVFYFLGDVYYFGQAAERDEYHTGDCENGICSIGHEGGVAAVVYGVEAIDYVYYEYREQAHNEK